MLKQPWQGHAWGVEKIKQVFEWCRELGIRHTTFYVLSLENLSKRPANEKAFLFELAKREIKDLLNDKNSFVHKHKVGVNCFGRLRILPKDLQQSLRDLMEATKGYSNYCLNLAIAYGGRQEILDACRMIARGAREGKLNPESINEAIIRQHLYTNGSPDPDLIIRTGQERRLSNFLLFQSAYSELAFTDIYWPELTKDEFLKIIHEFGNRERRFGK